MNLREWRAGQKLPLRIVAAQLGIPHARNYQRYEVGMVLMDAPMIESVVQLTNGAVTLADIHRQRLSWLSDNKKEN